ncbi:MAG: hypothetical protein M3Z83_09030, partial [Actinomycetota bacterium]|nr:hypothetical protein [Actinomycetota bacterium]
PEASAGDAASAGLLVTSAGVDGCVAALGEGGAAAVSIDIATYAGQPAAIVVVTRDGRASAYAVQRDCASGDPQIIHPAVPVP